MGVSETQKKEIMKFHFKEVRWKKKGTREQTLHILVKSVPMEKRVALTWFRGSKGTGIPHQKPSSRNIQLGSDPRKR